IGGRAKDAFHAVEHGGETELGACVRASGLDQSRAELGIRQQVVNCGGECNRILPRNHQRGVIIDGDFADRAGFGRYARHADQHRLYERLRYAFVGVRWKREDVQRAEPRRNIVLVADEANALAQAKIGNLPLQRFSLRALADDDQLRVTVVEKRHRVYEKTMAFPAAKRGDDSRQRNSRGQLERLAGSALRAWRKASRVDAGRNRAYPRGVDSQLLYELMADCFAGGDDLRRRAGIQPSRQSVARNSRGNVPRSHHGWRRLERATGDRRKPAVGRAVSVDHVEGMAREQPPQSEHACGMLVADRQRSRGHAETLSFGADARLPRAGKRDPVPTTDHSRGLSQDANLLATPAQRCFGVKNAQWSGRDGGRKLDVMQLRIQTVSRQQLLMGALFDHATGVENDDAINGFDRRQTMSDDE